MFIARISRGRTIRQFVTGVLLVPSLVSLVWFCIFGGAAIDTQRHGVDIAGQSTSEGQLFGLLHHFPLSSVTTILVVVLVAIFFVSGADAASIVMGTLSERGAIEPRKPVVVFWGVLTGAVAAVMLLVGGGGTEALQGLQNLTIVAALPFALVMVGLAVALAKDLRTDPLMLRKEIGHEAVEAAVIEGVSAHGDDFALVVTGNGNDSAPEIPDSPQPPMP
jgi:choline-glycine betaine transporter